MVKVIVAGCAGRMGKRIATLVLQNKDLVLAGGFERDGSPFVGHDIGELIGEQKLGLAVSARLEDVIASTDVIIDFTSPEATLQNVKTAVQAGKKIVVGTTGLSTEQEKELALAAQSIPIVFAPNMSLGVNLLFKLSRMVAELLNDEYDIEIVEAHHRHKKDAPSGTARELAKQVALGRGIDLETMAEYGREGLCGERERGRIGIHAVRGGDVVGEHTVSYMAEGERVELTHKASSRDAFAKGALVAARFLADKERGLYSMQDVLGLV
jgi:4-hydroxy-tetrahydrodipicolinate reductase